MNGLVFAIVSAFGFGLANGLAQRYVRDLGVGATMVGRSAVSSTLLFVLFLAVPHALSARGLGIAFAVAVLGLIAVFSYYRALGSGASGIVTPVANSAVVVTVVASLLIFGEALGAARYALIAAIVLGVVLLSADRARGLAAGVPFALVAMIAWGFNYALLVIPTRLVGPVAAVLVGELLALLAGLAWMLARRERIPWRGEVLVPLALVGASIVLGVAGFTFALRTVPVGIVAAIMASNPVVTALYMRVFHGERLSVRQRIASGIVIAGVVALSAL